MGKSSDQLREEIDAQRSDAGAKIDQLQTQLQDTVEGTRQTVTDTATQVAETVTQVREGAQAMVTDTVDSVKQSMEQTMADFDLEKMVEERPLMAAGMALVGGFLLGSIMGGGDDNSQRYSSSHSSGADTTGSGSSTLGFGQSMRSAAKRSGLEDTISNAGAALMGTVTEQLKDMVERSFPGFSDKLDTAMNEPGSLKDKIAATQQDGQKH